MQPRLPEQTPLKPLGTNKMFQNYIKVALRNLVKHKLYSAINVIGLAVGLTVYLLGIILADYERNHDTMYANYERIYTIGSVMSPNADIGVSELDIAHTTMGPLIKVGLPETEFVARVVRGNYLISNGDKHFNEQIKFADEDFTRIFDFDYIVGDASALDDPYGLIISESSAIKIFGSTDIYGQTVMLNHEDELRVKAVIKDAPKNSHFKSSVLGNSEIDFIAPITALNRIDGWDLDGNWNNLATGNYTYLMTVEPMQLEELSSKINAIFVANTEEELRTEFLSSLRPRLLQHTNSAVWDVIGMPVIESVQLLGLLVLVIAIVNYTNLATAQSMGRIREVGMRKTLGATRKQLLMQFLTESLTIAFFAMIISMVLLEIIVPQFNASLDKVVELNFLQQLPWLISTTVIVGLVAGAYPSYLITKTNPTEALKTTGSKGAKGSFFRSFMITTQFIISIFMLSLVMIVYFQNDKVIEGSNIFPKDEVLTIKRMNKEDILVKEDLLRNELLKHPDVTNVTFASQVPFEQTNNRRTMFSVKGDEASKFQMNMLHMDHDFIKTFDIPLIAGRDFSRDVAGDIQLNDDDRQVNIIISQMTAERLGFASANEALGQSIWGGERDDGVETLQYTVIGVVEDQNILGLHNNIKSWVFINTVEPHFYGAIRLRAGAGAASIREVEEIWKTVLPDYPMEHQFLNGLFEESYTIYRIMNGVLAGFAAMAMMLALTGLFGLSAFMAKGRTKEVGIRKVMGASITQIVNMLVWKFSKPVMWAILIAMPLAYLAADMYLQFFAERINWQVPILLVSGIVAVGLAWVVIALHAVNIARKNPIKALRYE